MRAQAHLATIAGTFWERALLSKLMDATIWNRHAGTMSIAKHKNLKQAVFAGSAPEEKCSIDNVPLAARAWPQEARCS